MKKILLIICSILALSGCNSSTETLSGKYNIEIDVQNYGIIEAELNADIAPITVSNFISLVENKFYDGLTFHRIIKDFMIQGGDPNHNGTGGSDKTIKGEFKNNGVTNNLSHKRGVISMARNSFNMDSASSQFFIIQKDSEYLDGDYAAFGYVTKGMDIVDKIAEDAKPIDDNGTINYEEQPVITSIKIINK